ncbi:MAG: hypothetical protein CMJ64_29165 [Planctomycetaceae bacterium]|nr:hypothetical protein [Planctomycetaceae bacterium]
MAGHGDIVAAKWNAALENRFRIATAGHPAAWSICTSHGERHSLTFRTLLKRFTRLNLGFRKKLDNLAAACQVFLAYYNFVWRTRYDDESGRAGQLRPTAAMMAGVTD